MRELTPDDCWRVLREERIIHIAQIDDGEPYVTPLSYVIHDGDLVFRTAPGRRVDALRRNPWVCAEASRETTGAGWESVLFWGTVRFVDDPSFEAAVVGSLLAKYHTESILGFSTPAAFPEDRLVLAVTPERITGRASGGDLSTETRPGRL